MRLLVPLIMLALGAPAPNAGAGEIDVKPRVNGEIRGKVIHLDTGRPFYCADAMLTGTRLRAVTAEDGTFVIRDVPAGLYTLRVVAPCYVPFELTEIATSWLQTLHISIPMALEIKRCVSFEKPHTFKYSEYVSAERFLMGTLRPRLESKQEILPLPREMWGAHHEWQVRWPYSPLWKRRRSLAPEELGTHHLENARLERAAVTWTEAWRRRLE